MQWAVQHFGPVVEEAAKFGKARREIVFLPYVEMQQAWVIRHVIVDFGGCQAIA